MTARVGGSGSTLEILAEGILQQLPGDAAVFVLIRRSANERAEWEVAARNPGSILSLPDALANIAHQIATTYHLELEITADGRPIYR